MRGSNASELCGSTPNRGPPLRGTHYGMGLWPVDRAPSRVLPNRIEAAMNVASKQPKGNTMSKKAETKALPTYRIYSVLNDGSDKSVWQEIGGAWPNKDGKGLNLYFKARPLEGAQIVLRTPMPKKVA
jgi:hypothetical protein